MIIVVFRIFFTCCCRLCALGSKVVEFLDQMRCNRIRISFVELQAGIRLFKSYSRNQSSSMHLLTIVAIMLCIAWVAQSVSTGTNTEDRTCELSVICNLVRGDLSRMFTYDPTFYGYATTLAGKLKNRGFKEHECGIVFSNCNAELMSFVSVKINMTGKMSSCPWSTYPYMMFHCSTIHNWPTAAVEVLKPEHKSCSLLPDCKYAFDEFEKFNSKGLPADWSRRKPNKAPNDPGVERRQAPRPVRRLTREEMQKDADDRTSDNVRSRADGQDKTYSRLPWQFCDPGTYVSEYYFHYYMGHGNNWAIGPYSDFGFSCTSLDIGGVERNSHGPTSSVKAKNQYFFTGITLINWSKQARPKEAYLGEYSYLQLYILGFGISEDTAHKKLNWATPLPSTIPVPLYYYFDGRNTSIYSRTDTIAAFRRWYNRERYFEFTDIHCPNQKVICGFQRLWKVKYYLHSLRIYCCQIDLQCTARTVFEVEYSVDLTNRRVGEDPGKVTFDRSQGFIESVSTADGGSISHAIMVSVEATVTIPLTMTLTAGFSASGSYTGTTERNWLKTISESKTVGTSISETRVPILGCTTRYYRAVGICGTVRVIPSQTLIEVVLPNTRNCDPSSGWQLVDKKIKPVANVQFDVKEGIEFTRPARSLVEGEPFLNVSEITKGLRGRFESKEMVDKLKTTQLAKYLSQLVKTVKREVTKGTTPQIGLVYQQIGYCDDLFENQFTVYTEYTAVLEFPKIHGCGQLWDEIRPILTPKNRPLIVYNFNTDDLEYTVDTQRIGFYVPSTPSTKNLPPSERDKDRNVKLPLPAGVSGGEEYATELKKHLVRLGISKNTSIDWDDAVQQDWDLIKDLPGGEVIAVAPKRQLHLYEAVAHCDSYTIVWPEVYYEVKNGDTCESSGGFEKECSYSQRKNG